MSLSYELRRRDYFSIRVWEFLVWKGKPRKQNDGQFFFLDFYFYVRFPTLNRARPVEKQREKTKDVMAFPSPPTDLFFLKKILVFYNLEMSFYYFVFIQNTF